MAFCACLLFALVAVHVPPFRGSEKQQKATIGAPLSRPQRRMDAPPASQHAPSIALRGSRQVLSPTRRPMPQTGAYAFRRHDPAAVLPIGQGHPQDTRQRLPAGRLATRLGRRLPAKLDAAVAAAYSRPGDLTDVAIIERLLALNRAGGR